MRSLIGEGVFARIIEFLPDATFVIDRNKRIVAWNRACEVMTGVPKQALLGQGDYAYAEAFYGERHPILIDLLDVPATGTAAGYQYIERKGDVLCAEMLIPRLRGGRGAHVRAEAAPLFDVDGNRCGAIEVVRDITEQKRTEAALLASEREYRELVMLANSIILRWSRDGRITFINEFGQRFFGYTAAELVGRHVVGTIVPEGESTGRDLRPLMERICADPKQFERNVNENVRQSGEHVWIDWTNRVVLDEQGQITEILSIGSDITERKQAEGQVRLLNEQLRGHAEELERRVLARTAQLAEKNQELKEFAYTVSHDLKAPLRGIAGYANELNRKHRAGLGDRAQFCVAQILTAATHLDQLIEDLLRYSRLDAETPSAATVDLRGLVDMILSRS